MARLSSNPIIPSSFQLTFGRRYITIVVAAFTINFTACGLLFAFGVYQAQYETLALEDGTSFTGASSADIDLIGTLSISMMTIGAPLAVAWAKHFPPQLVVVGGGILFGISNILASFGRCLWHFQIAQGFLLGVGTCLTFMPSMTVAPVWFGQHRALAMGIISAGTGIGGLIWAPVTTACIAHMGFRNTLRLTGGLATVLLCAAGAALSWETSVYLHMQEGETKCRGIKKYFLIPLPSAQMIRQRKFIAQILSAAFQSAAYYTPTFFIVSYAEGLGYSETMGANLTAVSNACNAIGKIGMGFLADRIGRVNAFWLTTLLTAAAVWGLWVPSTLVGQHDPALARSLFIAFTIMFGTFASAFISLFPPVLAELVGVQELPRVSGVMYLTQGVAAIIGTPVAGVLIRGSAEDRKTGNFAAMSMLVGGLMLAASMTVGWVRMELLLEKSSARRRWIWKS